MALADLLGGGPKKKSRTGSSSSQHGEKKDDKAASHKIDKDDMDMLPDRPENCPSNAVLTATGFWCVPDGRKCRLCVRCDAEEDPAWKRKGIVRCMYWAYQPRPSFVTSGWYCGYCAKVHLAIYQSFVCNCSCNHIVGE